jgi:hypothetical protein
VNDAHERGERSGRRGLAGPALALAFAGAPMLLGGCQTPPPRTSGRPMTGDDVPRCMQESRRLEQLGIEAIDHAQKETTKSRKQEKYDVALDYLHRAVSLYEDEQSSNPGTPEKQRACDLEITRLNEEIHRTHKDRPL